MPTTPRLLLRQWREQDRDPFAALNADPEVMRHFPATLNRAESDALVERIEAGFRANSFGLWAVEERATGEFLGFVGLIRQTFTAHFTPAVGQAIPQPAWLDTHRVTRSG